MGLPAAPSSIKDAVASRRRSRHPAERQHTIVICSQPVRHLSVPSEGHAALRASFADAYARNIAYRPQDYRPQGYRDVGQSLRAVSYLRRLVATISAVPFELDALARSRAVRRASAARG